MVVYIMNVYLEKNNKLYIRVYFLLRESILKWVMLIVNLNRYYLNNWMKNKVWVVIFFGDFFRRKYSFIVCCSIIYLNVIYI